jgi:hypothetical protein
MKANDLQIKFFRILFTPLSVEEFTSFFPSCEGCPQGGVRIKNTPDKSEFVTPL